jgi:WD40 repeat protein
MPGDKENGSVCFIQTEECAIVAKDICFTKGGTVNRVFILLVLLAPLLSSCVPSMHPDMVLAAGHSEAVTAISWSRDGSLLAAGGHDGALTIWDARKGIVLREMQAASPHLLSLRWSPAGNLLASTAYRTVQLWDGETAEELHRTELSKNGEGFPSSDRISPGQPVWSPGGEYLALPGGAGGSMNILTAAGQRVAALAGHPDWWSFASWHPDGDRIATISFDTVRIWETAGWKKETEVESGLRNGWAGIHWSPDGRRIAWYGRGRDLWVMDAETLARKKIEGSVTRARWNPDGVRLAVIGTDASVRVWNVESLMQWAVKRGKRPVGGFQWSPDGRKLAFFVRGEKFPFIWEMEAQRARSLPEHARVVTAISWNPDGKKLAVGTADGLVRVWDVQEVMKPPQ